MPKMKSQRKREEINTHDRANKDSDEKASSDHTTQDHQIQVMLIMYLTVIRSPELSSLIDIRYPPNLL